MREKFTIDEYKRIQCLVESALTAGTKVEAKRYYGQLNYLASDVIGYSRIVFAELVAATVSASGRVKDKDRLTVMAFDYLSKFQMLCVEQ